MQNIIKRIRLKYFLFWISPVLLSTTCEEDPECMPYYITFVNSCEEPIYVGGFGYMSSIEDDMTVADVFEDSSEAPIKILPNNFETHFFNNMPGKIDQYMFFRESTMEKHSIKELIELNIYDYLFKGPYKEISKYNKEWGYYIEYK